MRYATRVLSLAIGLAFPIYAVPVTWYLQGVTFGDGGRLIGQFTYDADSKTYSNVRVFSTPGSDVKTAKDPTIQRAGRDYAVPNSDFFATGSQRANFKEAGPTVKVVTGILNLEFATPLANTGGSSKLTASSSENFYVDNGGTLAGPIRIVNAGNVVAVSATGPQTWYLNGVTLDDGSQAIGSLVFDAASGNYSQVQIQTTAGGTFSSSASYINQFTVPAFNTAVATPSNLAVTTTATPTAGGRVLNFALDSALTNAQGSVNISTTAASAEGTCQSATCMSNGKVQFGGVIRNVVSGSLTTRMPASFQKVIPHLADGAAGVFANSAWQSVLVLNNISEAPVGFTLRNFSDDGTPLNVPGVGTRATGLVPARGTVIVKSTASGALTSGWTRVDNAQNLSVSNQLVLVNANASGDQQSAMYGDALGSYALTVSYDNTLSASAARTQGASILNGFAVSNPDPVNKVTLLVVGYDTAGNIVATDSSITLNPLGHQAFLFSGIPALAALAANSAQGNIRLYPLYDTNTTAPLMGINCLLLKFQAPNFSFANISVVNQ